MLLFVAAITFIAATCSSVQGLNYDDKEFGPAESGCPNLSVDPSLNITWVRLELNIYELTIICNSIPHYYFILLNKIFQLKSIDYWTIPLWSKKQLYLSVKLSATPEEFANTTEDTLRNSCFLLSGIKKEHSKVSYHGLNKKFFEWDASMRFNRDGIVDWFKIKGKLKAHKLIHVILLCVLHLICRFFYF